MTKVLVPVDGSKGAIRALEYVAARARRGEKIDVEILYVQGDARPTPYITKDMIKDWQKSERDRVFSDKKMRTLKKRLDARVTVKTGDIASVIVNLARKARCNEIVMGTRGMGRLKGLLLGSIATKVAQLSPVPVTLVK
jgi:nucleotide-binding universal stress UspA family protein